MSNHDNRLGPNSGIGFVGNKNGLGFLIHSSLIIDANKETKLGYSDTYLWHREEDKSNTTTRAYKKQLIEEKESYKWIRASQNSKEVLKEAKSITIVEDREGDIYEQFCLVPDEKTNLVIRSKDNRKLANGCRLYETMASEPLAGKYVIKIDSDKRKKKQGRLATIEIRFKKVLIQKPKGKLSKKHQINWNYMQ